MLAKYRIAMIFISIIAGMTLWVTDAALDYFFNDLGGSFIQILAYEKPRHEFLLRVIASVLITSLGLTLTFLGSRARESETRYAELFEKSRNALLVVQPIDGAKDLSLIDVNRQACLLSGFSRSELLNLTLGEIVHPQEAPRLFARLDNLSNDEVAGSELTLVRKDGESIHVDFVAWRLKLGETLSYFLSMRDITEKKTAEDQLKNSEKQLRVLTARLMTAQEDERRRISIGLHDELGQALMHLKFRISALARKCEEHASVSQNDCSSVLSSMDEVIEYVRKLSRDLSPTVLEELGLTGALQYLLEEFSEHYKIAWKFAHLDDIDHLFPQQTQVSIFRIFQETLTNVVRHSLATRMSVTVQKEDANVLFMVEDDGVGFEVDKVFSAVGTQAGIGIPSMQERVRMIGGLLSIRSQRGMGTRVAFQVPVESREINETSIAV